MDAPNIVEIFEVEMARRNELAVKGKKKEYFKRIKRGNKLMFASNRRLDKIVDEFLLAAEAENSDPGTAKTWTKKVMKEVIKIKNDLNGSTPNGDKN